MLVSDRCGLFVRADSAGNDGAPGTKDQPFKSIKAAVAAVDKQWIFVCSSTPVQEKVTIGKDNVSIFGGFDCANGWAWNANAKTTLGGDNNLATLTITGQGVVVQDFKVQGADATLDGASSIAVIVSHASPTFNRCEIIAGKAKDGDPGADIVPGTAPAGADGNPGAAACSDDPVPGGAQVTNDCLGAEVSIGGKGGDGFPSNGDPGVAGQPSNGTNGAPGLGEPSSATNPAWSCTVGNGKPGGPGGAGMPGSGATDELGLGILSVDGFISVSGKDGTSGQAGQGGGGGGAAKGGTACSGATKGGASGGSGASGGCGGAGGRGGHGAGASIALVSLESPGITLKDSTLTAADGASGGKGGDAQAGGPGGTKGGAGGTGGFMLNTGCLGGAGGRGGDGGPGGGGRGGHSIGLAYTGNPPAISTDRIKVGQPGAAGPGGNDGLLMNDGAPGIAAAVQAFSTKP
jgi:hypothetical protein